jgi:hypothetical protein
MDLVALRFLVALSRLRRAKTLGPRIERWVADGVLQWQRRAYEYDGQGDWVDKEKEVPVTRGKEDLVDLVDGYLRVGAKGKNGREGEGGDDGETTKRKETVVEETIEPSKSLREVRTEATMVDEVNDGRDSGVCRVGWAQEHGRVLQDVGQDLLG